MDRFAINESGLHIHLAVEGSCGGTSFGLHLAANAISAGHRVLWASSDMPDAQRFQQLFAHLSLVESSRFHAMNFGGRFDRAIDAILEAANALPSVTLIVLDDWCPSSGRIPATNVKHVQRMAEHVPEETTLLLISKGSIDASGSSGGAMVARGKEAMERAGYATWRLLRRNDGAHRQLDNSNGEQILVIEDSGFVV